MSCGTYIEQSYLEQAMKVVGRVQRVEQVTIDNMHFGIMPVTGTITCKPDVT